MIGGKSYWASVYQSENMQHDCWLRQAEINGNVFSIEDSIYHSSQNILHSDTEQTDWLVKYLRCKVALTVQSAYQEQ